MNHIIESLFCLHSLREHVNGSCGARRFWEKGTHRDDKKNEVFLERAPIQGVRGVAAGSRDKDGVSIAGQLQPMLIGLFGVDDLAGMLIKLMDICREIKRNGGDVLDVVICRVFNFSDFDARTQEYVHS
jgi:hypothetical protein